MTAVTHVATETAITIEVDEAARAPVHPLDTIALATTATAATDETEPIVTPTTTVVEMMTAMTVVTEAWPRSPKTNEIDAPFLSSSSPLDCGLVS